MRKGTVTLFVVIMGFISAFTFVPAFSQEDIATLEDSAFQDGERPPAVFVHDQHNEKAQIDECNVCHHIYEGGKKLQDDSNEGTNCSACHHVDSSNPTRPLMKAYHDLCKSCHQENKAGPITCGECHPK